MKSITEVLDNYKDYETFLDDRFGIRLCEFLTVEQMGKIGFGLKEGVDHTPKEWNAANVIAQLYRDAEFGLEKAEDERGISSALMCSVCQSWLKVLGIEAVFPKPTGYGNKFFEQIIYWINNSGKINV